MAQQDKTDWYWNGVLAGAVNNLYYELINVDVTHVPYTATHRNSSFFLKNRLGYIPSGMWAYGDSKDGRDVTDIKVIWNSKCDKTSGQVYALAANPFRTKGRVYKWDIVDGCVNETSVRMREYDAIGCGDWKLFITDYVKGAPVEDVIDGDCSAYSGYSGIQINEYEGGTTHGYFSDKCIEESGGESKFSTALKGYFLLVYDSKNADDSGFAGQVRLITDVDSKGRLILEAPWEGFATLSSDSDEKEVKGTGLKYLIYKDWGEVVGYSTGKKITIITDAEGSSFKTVSPYSQISPYLDTNIIGVASAANRIFVLTDNGWIHYTNTPGGYDKFFIQDDMFAGIDKTSIASYRDFVVTFGKKHLGICVPDSNGSTYTVYDQSSTVGLWSRYSYGEYDGDLLFVSNDKRLLALGVASNTGQYMLQYENVGDSSAFNSKLSTLIEGDEVFVGDDRGDLKVFVNYRSNPYIETDLDEHVTVKDGNSTSTHIYKFDKLFKVWTEDHISNFCLWGVYDGLYYGESGIYARDSGGRDKQYGDYLSTNVVARISAYLIENETDWIGGTSSWLANRPKLYNLAKLNRLITILGPGKYSGDTKIHITSYVNGVGTEYEFPIGTNGNDVNNIWVDQISRNYTGDDTELEECQLEVLKDNQTEYKATCEDSKVTPYSLMQDKPWCDSYKEILLPSHGVCIDDSIYKLAPSMPLVTNLGESQSYATQIKLELVSYDDDITFGGRLGEMFIAPLFSTGPDGEYQLQPQSDC